MLHDWNGIWIGADMTVEDRFAPVFKKEFYVDRDVKSVDIYISGLGLFDIRINGVHPDDSVLNPAHTQYTSTVLYRVFNVASLIKNGRNILTVELGNFFFNETGGVWKWQVARWRSTPKLIADIVINYSDGTKKTVSTDTSWIVTKDGPTVENSIYSGETYDARKTEDSFVWTNAVHTQPPEGQLKEQNMPPIRRINTMKPKNIIRNGNSYIITSPEMVTGWISLNINEPKDVCVTISYSERLDEQGYTVIIGKGEGRDGNWWPESYIQQDKFISNGEPFVFEPKFSYKGFKYIQIDNYSGVITADDITIYRVANDVAVVSEFECSDESVNMLHKLAKRTMLNNFQGKPTDTPVWEKNGWLGDVSCSLESMMYNFDMSTFLSSFIDTVADCFVEYGTVPDFAPIVGWGNGNSPVWNTVFVFAVKALCDYCGNVDYAKKIYPLLRKFAIEYIDRMQKKDFVWGTDSLADWVAPSGEENKACGCMASEGAEICATAYVYKMLIDMCVIAEITGNDNDCNEYKNAAEVIYKAFNNKFYNAKKGIYETTFWKQEGKRDSAYRQTSNIIPLAFGMVPENYQYSVAEKLNADIINRGYHLDTGCIGTKFILPVLINNGYTDTAFKVLTQYTYPSWGFWLKNGADTAWESWETDTRSQNHYFLSTYEETLYSHYAGICDIKNGYEYFTVKPCLENGFDYVSAVIDSPKGKVRIFWKKENGNINIKITVPEKSTARIIIEYNGKRIEEKKSFGEYNYIITID